MIGVIKTSILAEDDFNNEHENEEWVLMDGRDVSGSEYSKVSGKNVFAKNILGSIRNNIILGRQP